MGEAEQTRHELLLGFAFPCHPGICSSCPRGHPQHQTDKWTRQGERTGNACKRLINKFVSGQMRELVRASQHQSLQHNTAARSCLRLKQQPGEGEVSPALGSTTRGERQGSLGSLEVLAYCFWGKGHQSSSSPNPHNSSNCTEEEAELKPALLQHLWASCT